MPDELILKLDAREVQRAIDAALKPYQVAHNRLVERVTSLEDRICQLERRDVPVRLGGNAEWGPGASEHVAATFGSAAEIA